MFSRASRTLFPHQKKLVEFSSLFRILHVKKDKLSSTFRFDARFASTTSVSAKKPAFNKKEHNLNRVVIIDGSNFVHRYLFALNNIEAAVSLFGVLLLKAVTLLPPVKDGVEKILQPPPNPFIANKVVVCFDQISVDPWRLSLAPHYKYIRKESQTPKKKQTEHRQDYEIARSKIRLLCRYLHVNIFPQTKSLAGEGDDIIHTLRARLGPDIHTTILSDDTDIFQCLALYPHKQTTALYRPFNHSWHVSPRAIERVRKCSIQRINIYQALHGDQSDNIPACAPTTLNMNPQEYQKNAKFQRNLMLVTLRNDYPLYPQFGDKQPFRPIHCTELEEGNTGHSLQILERQARNYQTSIFSRLNFTNLTASALRQCQEKLKVNLEFFRHLLGRARHATDLQRSFEKAFPWNKEQVEGRLISMRIVWE